MKVDVCIPCIARNPLFDRVRDSWHVVRSRHEIFVHTSIAHQGVGLNHDAAMNKGSGELILLSDDDVLFNGVFDDFIDLFFDLACAGILRPCEDKRAEDSSTRVVSMCAGAISLFRRGIIVPDPKIKSAYDIEYSKQVQERGLLCYETGAFTYTSLVGKPSSAIIDYSHDHPDRDYIISKWGRL
jgi:hypothetical protein